MRKLQKKKKLTVHTQQFARFPEHSCGNFKKKNFTIIHIQPSALFPEHSCGNCKKKKTRGYTHTAICAAESTREGTGGEGERSAKCGIECIFRCY